MGNLASHLDGTVCRTSPPPQVVLPPWHMLTPQTVLCGCLMNRHETAGCRRKLSPPQGKDTLIELG